MKTLTKITILLTLFIKISYSWTADTSKLFVRKDVYLEFGADYSIVLMSNINKHYINEFAKDFGFTDKNIRNAVCFYPEIGFIFNNLTGGISYSYFKTSLAGHFGFYDNINNYLITEFKSIAMSVKYRFKINEISQNLLPNFGGKLYYGTGTMYLGVNKDDYYFDSKYTAKGGGGDLFVGCDINPIEYVLFGIKAGLRVLITKTLKDESNNEWYVDVNSTDTKYYMNMDYNGFFVSATITLVY